MYHDALLPHNKLTATTTLDLQFLPTSFFK